MKTLVLILRDQLSRHATALDDLDPETDAVAMTEADVNRGRYPEHKQRLALGLAAMRHVRNDLRARGLTVHYEPIDAENRSDGPAAFLRRQIEAHQPEQVRITEPGRYELLEAIEQVCEDAGVGCTVHADDHFLVTHETFEDWAEGRKELTLEYFYREQRRAYDVLVTDDGDPVGGDWNFDDENREAFGANGPGLVPEGPTFERDATTRDAIRDVGPSGTRPGPSAPNASRFSSSKFQSPPTGSPSSVTSTS